MTLNLERLVDVDAADPRSAVERAVLWESNEDDPDVQLQYEEVTGHRVEPADDDEDTETVGGDG